MKKWSRGGHCLGWKRTKKTECLIEIMQVWNMADIEVSKKDKQKYDFDNGSPA